MAGRLQPSRLARVPAVEAARSIQGDPAARRARHRLALQASRLRSRQAHPRHGRLGAPVL